MSSSPAAKTIEWYNQHAAEYAAKVAAKRQLGDIQLFSEYLSPGAQVLDAGCAAGEDTALLTDQGFAVIGIDLSEELLKIARKNYPTIEFQNQNILQLSFADETFAGVWASASLVHLVSLEAVQAGIKELARVMQKGGVLYIAMQERVGQKSGWVKDDHSQEGRYFQFVSLEQLQQLVVEAGLQVEHAVSRESSRPGISWSIVVARK